MNMLYIPIMSSRPVQISIAEELLERIDADPETRKDGRSAFIRQATVHYLAAKQSAQIDQEIRKAYSGRGGELAEKLAVELDGLLGAQEWPES